MTPYAPTPHVDSVQRGSGVSRCPGVGGSRQRNVLGEDAETAAVQILPSLSANGNGYGAVYAPLTAIAS